MATDLRASVSLVIAGAGGGGRDHRQSRLSSRSRLRAAGAEARRLRRRHRAPHGLSEWRPRRSEAGCARPRGPGRHFRSRAGRLRASRADMTYLPDSAASCSARCATTGSARKHALDERVGAVLRFDRVLKVSHLGLDDDPGKVAQPARRSPSRRPTIPPAWCSSISATGRSSGSKWSALEAGASRRRPAQGGLRLRRPYSDHRPAGLGVEPQAPRGGGPRRCGRRTRPRPARSRTSRARRRRSCPSPPARIPPARSA